jgi:hypothetical protein
MLFGSDSYDPSLLSLLVGILGLAVWLAFAPNAGTTLGQFPVRPSRSNWPIFVIATLGAVLWSAYSVRAASDFWSGQRYTGVVDVISGQAGLAPALAALPPGVALGWLPVRLPMWTGATLGFAVPLDAEFFAKLAFAGPIGRLAGLDTTTYPGPNGDGRPCSTSRFDRLSQTGRRRATAAEYWRASRPSLARDPRSRYPLGAGELKPPGNGRDRPRDADPG